MTVQAAAGLTAFASLIVSLLAFSLWVLFVDLDQVLLVRGLLSLAAGGLAVWLLSWLWQPPGEVAGVELRRSDSPAFFRLLDRTCEAMRLAPVNTVLIGSDVNASVVQVPELGLWGRLETHLIVGLPLLHSVNATQFEAILAHELSHLSLQRGPGAAWGAQLRAWWHRVLSEIDGDRSAPARLTALLLARHADSYLVNSVRLAHFEEFEADAGAAALVGAEVLAGALIEVAHKERFLREEYWDAVMAQFEFPEAGAAILPYRAMGAGVSLGFHRDRAASDMRDIFEHAQGLELHPRLIERLAALKVGPHSVLAEEPSVADGLLCDLAAPLACRLDRAWCMALAPCCK